MRNNDWMLTWAVIGYMIVTVALVVLVAPIADAVLDDVIGFVKTLEWLANHLTGG